MKTNKSNQQPAFARLRPGRRVTNGRTDPAGAERSGHASRVTSHVSAFTLLELLTVIGIIVVIAALLLPVGSIVKQRAVIRATQAQMAQLETAIDRYKSAYGFYPPCNTNRPDHQSSSILNCWARPTLPSLRDARLSNARWQHAEIHTIVREARL